MPLNLESVRLAQANNAAVLVDVKRGWQGILEENVGYRPGPVPDMAWLGVGDLSSSSSLTNRPVDFLVLPFITENAGKLVNNGKHFPAFQQLDRPASLKSKCRIVATNEVDQVWIHRVWNNENLVFSVHEQSQCKEDDGDERVECNISTTDEPLARYVGFSQASGRQGQVIFHPEASKKVEPQDKHILLFRVFHTFLRNHAYMLPAHNLEELATLLETHSPLHSKKYKADYLDWQILRTDLLLNLPPPDDSDEDDGTLERKIGNHLMLVGDALAALERFDEAAPLYVEIGDTFAEAPVAYQLAAVSFKLLGNEDAALEFSAKQLGRAVRDDPDPDLNNPDYENVLAAIVTTYHAKFEKNLQGRTRPRHRVLGLTFEDIEVLGCVALISAAHPKMGRLAELFGVPPSTNLPSRLKNKVRRTAKTVLVKLMRSGSIEEYKKIFTSCLQPNKPIPFVPSFDTSLSDAFRQQCIEDSRKGASCLIKNGHSPMCSNCGGDQTPKKLMRCPCGKAVYCSKECQVDHWKFHKSKCSHQKKKQAK